MPGGRVLIESTTVLSIPSLNRSSRIIMKLTRTAVDVVRWPTPVASSWIPDEPHASVLAACGHGRAGWSRDANARPPAASPSLQHRRRALQVGGQDLSGGLRQ
jgi:hypothetical protein